MRLYGLAECRSVKMLVVLIKPIQVAVAVPTLPIVFTLYRSVPEGPGRSFAFHDCWVPSKCKKFCRSSCACSLRHSGDEVWSRVPLSWRGVPSGDADSVCCSPKPERSTNGRLCSTYSRGYASMFLRVAALRPPITLAYRIVSHREYRK